MPTGFEVMPNGFAEIPDIQWYVACNGTQAQDMQAGELVGLRIVAGVQSLTKLRLAGAAAPDNNLAAVNGILGLVLADFKTDASGNPTQRIPSGVSAAAVPILPLPNIAAGIFVDADGMLQVPVARFTAGQRWKARFGPSAGVVADNNIVGLRCGLLLGTGGVMNGKWVLDNGAAIKPFIIVDVDELDANFNLSCDGDTTPFRTCQVTVEPDPVFLAGMTTGYYTA